MLKSMLFIHTLVAGAFADRGSQTPDEPQQLLHPDNRFAEGHDYYKTVPQGHEILLSVDGSLSTVPAELDVRDASMDGMSLRKALELAKVKAVELDLKQVASDIEMWLEHHPWKAAFYAASAIGFFAPEILSIPALEALGFAVAGVRAGVSPSSNDKSSRANRDRARLGSVAAKIQSVIGPIAARSVFAIWQSARMGGYGVAYVNGGVRALIALADATVAACNPLKDCKGLISDGGQRSLGDLSTKTALAIVCGGFVVLYTVLE
ncbi:MAG: hypothetical protein LQ343_002478 [Gyalolechia ehrenbergii]|nr:MAG: hypothetical protein LQ343_002478 [Gyalolechia ehrenbergii]